MKVTPHPLAQRVRKLPDAPGVYLFRSASGDVVYVGKAKDLRKRVSSYFRGGAASPRAEKLLEVAEDLDFVVAGTELEALILESNLIKEYRPRFNVNLRDDKSYPYLVVTVADRYPRLVVLRRPDIEGAKVYGPFTAGPLRQTLDLLRSIFPVATCRTPEKGRNGQAPCLDYHIKRCAAPCIRAITPQDYRKLIDSIDLFLEGRHGKILTQLGGMMKMAASRLEYERAGRLRDQIAAVRRIAESQKVISGRIREADAVGVSQGGNAAVAQLLSVREHKLVGSKYFIFRECEESAEVIRAFLLNYYRTGSTPPREILLQGEVEDRGVLQEWLTERSGWSVRLVVPRRGEKRALVEMAERNAGYSLEKEQLNLARAAHRAEGLAELARKLGLDESPHRIEGFDISNIQGSQAVGSMVVFVEGRPHPAGYRRFRIRSEAAPDDLRMMREVLARRFARVEDERFGALPDLVVVDGGPAQLAAAKEVLAEAGVDLPAVGLAKRLEEIHLPYGEVVRLPSRSPALQVLQHLRDEAHRFALTYHRGLRGRSMLASRLEKVRGIGPRRRKRLLSSFASVEEIARSTPEQLHDAAGLPLELAEEVIAQLRASESRPAPE